jgi:Mg-chelatase subunit ChlD
MKIHIVAIGFAFSLLFSANGEARSRATEDPTGQPIAKGQQRHRKRPKRVNRVDLVIALDTSGSMSGLISSARQKLWDIVNVVGEKHQKAKLRVALLTYGSSGNENDGYVRVRSQLTSDLDSIYSKLFELSTSGGTEYVGRAVHRATRELDWHRGKRTLRVIFVAGNESADQDRRMPVVKALRQARRKGIFVNAIYCGNKRDSAARSWRRVANGGRGVYAAIDHNNGTVNVATPYDRRIKKLSEELNSTYVAYGKGGLRRAKLQKDQDNNAERTHAAAGAARAVAKAGSLYRNDHWDLVDARKGGKHVRRGELPAKLRKMSKAELDGYLNKMETKRKKLRSEIKALAAQRKTHIRKEVSKRGLKTDGAFDAAVMQGL